MTTEWNTESMIRTSKILACLHGILGVWIIVISTIAISAFDHDDLIWKGACPMLVTGLLMLIIVACFACLAFKGSDVRNDATIKRIRIMMEWLGWISVGSICELVIVPLIFNAVKLTYFTYRTRRSERALSINLVLVSTLAMILTLLSGILAMRFAKYFNSAKFLTSRLPPSSQLHQPLQQWQHQPGRCSTVQDLPSPTASTISIVERNVNNSVIREPSLPPSYDNLSMHSSAVSNYRATSTFSADGTPPPNYSNVMQAMTRNYPTHPPNYDDLSVHSSVISNYRASSLFSADGTPPPNYSSVMQTMTRNYPMPPPNYDDLSVHLSFISTYNATPTYSADVTPPPSYSSVTQTLTGIMY